jgi:hypothetical protein
VVDSGFGFPPGDVVIRRSDGDDVPAPSEVGFYGGVYCAAFGTGFSMTCSPRVAANLLKGEQQKQNGAFAVAVEQPPS